MIRTLHSQSWTSAFGYRRVSSELGLSVKRTRSLMRRHSLKGRCWRKSRGCTRSVSVPGATNLMPHLDHSQPSRIFAGDVTELQLRSGSKAYLCSLMDVCTRQILGYNVGLRNDTHLTLGALNMLVASRNLGKLWIHHSDRGSNYAADLYKQCIYDHNGLISYSDPGTPTQNAFAESFFSTFKLEQGKIFNNLQEARIQIQDYILFYNTKRRHSSIGNKAPDTYYKELALQ